MSYQRKQYKSVFDLKEGEDYTPTYKQTSTFESRFKDQKDNLYEKVLGRQSNPIKFNAADFNFQYDSDTDKNFQDYAKMMRESGQKAMTDTMARASAQTGGYGNSYAAMAGQSVYNDYLNEIGKAKTEFEDRAYEKALNEYNIANEKALNEYNMQKSAYDNETNDMLAKLDILNAREAEDRALFDAQLAEDKAAWESAYQEDLARAIREGDYDALAKLYGYESTDDYLADTRTELPEEELINYINAIKTGKEDEYYTYLSDKGYNMDNIDNDVKNAVTRGIVDYVPTIGNAPYTFNSDGSYSYGEGDTEVRYYTSSNINQNITGVNNKEGSNFHVKVAGDNYDVELGAKQSEQDNPYVYAVAHQFGESTALFMYNGGLYLTKEGTVYKVQPQKGIFGTRKDEFEKLKSHILTGSRDGVVTSPKKED